MKRHFYTVRRILAGLSSFGGRLVRRAVVFFVTLQRAAQAARKAIMEVLEEEPQLLDQAAIEIVRRYSREDRYRLACALGF